MTSIKRNAGNISVLESQSRRKALGKMVAYYRANPHRFVTEWLQINLKLFQKILIYMMCASTHFMLIASRGLGKTFIVALFCCVRCILFPGTKICICAGVRSQSNEVLNKIELELRKWSPRLSYEIEKSIIRSDEGIIKFKNSSWIQVVTSSDTARSKRANIIFVDEFVKTDINVVNTVLRRFLTSERHPRFMDKPEYKDYPHERNREIYASSAWWQAHWSYTKFLAYAQQMLNDKKHYFVCGLPYQLAIKEGLLSRAQIEDEMSEADFNEITWLMEMCTIFVGETDETFFNFGQIDGQRRLRDCFPTVKQILQSNAKVPDLMPNERRILSVDVALMASRRHNNDASALEINSAIPREDNQYISNYVYIDTKEGLTTDELGMEIMRHFNLYKCTDLVLDTNGIGVSLFDYITQSRYDPTTGLTYPAMTTIDTHDPMFERSKDPNAIRVVWSIKANASFNNNIALSLRSAFSTHKINLLIDDHDAHKILNLENRRGYKKLTSEEQVDIRMPYVQTTLLINELVNLQFEINGTNIKLREKANMRKDRYSSMAYNNFVVGEIEREFRLRKNRKFNVNEVMMFRKPVLRKNTIQRRR